MAYQLRERDPTTVEEMKINVVKVEANLLAKRAKLRIEIRFTFKEEPSFSSSDSKLDNLVKAMEKKDGEDDSGYRTPPRELQGGPKIQNPNFKGNPAKIKKRE